MFWKMIRKIISKIFIESPNKTVKLIIHENGRQREFLFMSVLDAESYAKSEGFETYKVIPQGRIEY